MRTANAITRIAALAPRYKRAYLTDWSTRRDELLVDWRVSVEFLLGHLYFQGRRDSLSSLYCDAALEVLRTAFPPQRSRHA